MEREQAVLNHTKVVQPFLKDAFKEGAHRIRPKTSLSEDGWARQIMIGVVYNDIGSTETLEESAEKHGTFRQSVARSNKSFLRNLWNNSSPELQEQYPLEEILAARKPLSQQSRERSSLSRGAKSLKIRAQVEQGITDIRTISKNTSLPEIIVRRQRQTLKGWGVDLPIETVSYKEDLESLEKESDYKKTQELLDKIPLHVVHHDLERKREASQFSSLSPLIREAGFRSKYNHLFAASLKSARVPVPITRKVVAVKGDKHGTKTYYILLSRHKDRAIKALREDQSLQKFRR